ncbi:MAG: NAD(P) transhydrogenase subunit beta [Saprospiraceae bacterium]|jgi:NAD(P) transhydrogenase subunit beta
MLIDTTIDISYLIGAVLFVWGLRLLGSPDTARKGNTYATIGMALGILAVLLDPRITGGGNYGWIAGGMLIGGLIGWFAAKKIQMTAMPQMVSVFNGLGGACAAVLAMVELTTVDMDMGGRGISLFALLIGGMAFTGSMLAYLKLDGKIWDSQVTWPKHNIINQVLMVATLAFLIYLIVTVPTTGLLVAFLLLCLFYGWSFVAPIGGADMPVVISLLNSFTGLSAAAAGLIYGNNLMIVGGILVGASGTILTVLMCQAMNRSLFNVLIGGFAAAGGAGADSGDQVAKTVNAVDAAILLNYSSSVMFVPGYGLAVAQAQKALKELDDLLESNGVDVKYAIHPVAGRMPGHMNVLLAEADVPYPKLLDLDDANSALPNTDVVVIVGANDVVNPAAEDEPTSSIYGMPVLQVWNAKHVIVMKRSMSPGYAGIQNQLFFHEKTKMFFGDAKDSIQGLVGEVKNL